MIYTLEDYYRIEDVNLWELVKGVLHMSPPPRIIHQIVSLGLSRDLGNYFINKKCEVLEAPVGLQLGENIVQPDIFVICDLSKLSKQNCVGIPDLIIEILSPRTKEKDLPNGVKFNLYQDYGLREYWIAEPEEEWIDQYQLIDRILTFQKRYTKEQLITSIVFPELTINLNQIFKSRD